MFDLVSEFFPSGDQPKSIESILKGLQEGHLYQTLKGVTGSGKTFTMANIIAKNGKPTLILSHNKTLAAQLYREFKEFFPQNAVEYFVSYFDYYQPEAYLPSRDLYIEKESTVNEELERFRISTTVSLLTRRDVIVIATVSAIYGITPPDFFRATMTHFEVGYEYSLDQLNSRLSELQYQRNQAELAYGTYQLKGDIFYIYPSYLKNNVVRLVFDFGKLTSIDLVHPLTLKKEESLEKFTLFSSEHFVTPKEQISKAIQTIEEEMERVYQDFNEKGKILEAQRIRSRTLYDIEMLKETGHCPGIENYTKHLTQRSEGSTPYTLFSYLPNDFLLIVDESHVTLPQIRGMYNGDRSRKLTLIDFGFRLPSAIENRPLRYEEFETFLNQVLYVSATPGEEEKKKSLKIIEQIIRPTGLIDPEISVRPTENQIQDLYGEIQKRIAIKDKVFITTLTKKMAEELTDYFANLKVRIRYLHSEINTFERVEILTAMRKDEIDVIVGINLLREGLDIPEVSLVAILDADKIGFLRSTTSLIQTIGRAARNARGFVIMYADRESDAMREAISETYNRREKQILYNKEHGIIPQTISKRVKDILVGKSKASEIENQTHLSKLSQKSKDQQIKEMTQRMLKASKSREFEEAAFWRDEIQRLKKEEKKKG